MIVSVVLIAFNEQSNLRAAVAAVLAQDAAVELEVIVVNDGSTDETLAIAQRMEKEDTRVRVVDLVTNAGRGAARGAGVAAATGSYIAFVDSDIILPPHWLSSCLAHIGEVAGCGGIAVPDGDVTWAHSAFALAPKVVRGSVPVTGNNGLFRREVFDHFQFDATMRQGEDVALNHAMEHLGMVTRTIPGLVVEHHEHKSFGQTAAWLFVSGVGATRQLLTSRRVRLPDLAAVGFPLVVAGSAAAAALGAGWWGAVPVPVYLLAVAGAHLGSKFHVARTPARAAAATLANAGLIAAYLAGRTAGLVAARRHRGA